MRSISTQMHLFDKQNVFMFSFLHHFTSFYIISYFTRAVLDKNLFTKIIHTQLMIQTETWKLLKHEL